MGDVGVAAEFTVCPNPDCKKISLTVGTFTYRYRRDYGHVLDKPLREWRLIPQSNAKVFPDYVPEAVRSDYTEACLIRELSPKAAATLARRSLQGMIRNYWDVSMSSLKLEIGAIESKVDPLTWQAIQGVRSVGNIGAHMEKDIDLIIDVDPEEAGMLIGLVEILVAEWYVARDTRQKSLLGIVDMAQAKEEERKGVLELDIGETQSG